MIVRNSRLLLLGSIFLFIAFGCSKEYRKYRKYSTKGTIDQRDSAAYYFFEKEDYEKAGFLFEELLGLYRGNPRGEDILYHLAYTKFNQKNYLVASYYFEQYSKNYPNNERAEECAYQAAFGYYIQSAPYYLDQSSTKQAIEQFQLFIVSYPGSDRIEKANSLIFELRERLAKKEFEQASLYFKIGSFKAALTAFEAFLLAYPDSRYQEEGSFMLFKSAVSFADISTDRRKKNRYLDALDIYQEFIDAYPESTFAKEAEDIYVKARKNLAKVIEGEEETS